jgi:hypothetical protein
LFQRELKSPVIQVTESNVETDSIHTSDENVSFAPSAASMTPNPSSNGVSKNPFLSIREEDVGGEVVETTSVIEGVEAMDVDRNLTLGETNPFRK